MNKLNIIDTTVIVIYAILCLFIAFRVIGKIRNIQEYAIGGVFSTRVLAATLFATYTGAGVLLGYIEKVYEIGLFFTFIILTEPLIWIITARVFTKNIEYFKRKGCMSISDIMQLLYGSFGKWVSNILSIALSVGVIAIQIKAIGYLSQYFLGLPEYVGAFIGFAIVIIYSFFGGIRAVIFTDVLQSLVFLVGIPTACFIAYYNLGGYTEIINTIPEHHKAIELTRDNIMLIVCCALYNLIPFTEIAFVQRFLIAKDSTQLKNALYYAFLLTVPFYVIIVLAGFVTLATVPDTTANLAFYELITTNLPTGIKGLVVAGLLAAIMSTADSFLNSASVMFAHNIMKPIFPNISARTELSLAKLATIFFSLLALIIAFTGESLAKIMWVAENFWTPFIVIPLVAGFLKFYTNSTSFKVSLFFALAGVMIGGYIAGEFGRISGFFGLMGSTIGFFGSHYLQKSTVVNQKEEPFLVSAEERR